MTEQSESKQDRQKKLMLQQQFNKRITIARHGREAFMEKDYVTCMHKYHEYLKILADSKNVDDIYKLSPSVFDEDTQLSELLLISHVYWEMARINEMTPKLQLNFQKSLGQFVKFTINQPYQVLNAEMLRKYIKISGKRSKLANKYQEAYQEIFINSNKCYIATHCFGDTHKVTQDLRTFKKELLTWPLGLFFVQFYYKHSSSLVKQLPKYKLVNNLFAFSIKPFLHLFSLFTQTSIFKGCSSYLKLLQKNGSNH